MKEVAHKSSKFYIIFTTTLKHTLHYKTLYLQHNKNVENKVMQIKHSSLDALKTQTLLQSFLIENT
jgi:hypothetical protein